MRRLLAFSCLAAALALVAATTLDRPPVPAHTAFGDEVNIELAIKGFDGEGLELELKEGPRGPLFLRFEIDAKNGQAVLTGARPRSQVTAMLDLPDWSFLGTRKDAPLMTHPFNNQLVELKDGGLALRVRYTGQDVPLFRSLRVMRNVTFPPFMGRALGHDGPVQLQRGTYPMEEDGGATIPVRLLGR